MQDVLGKVKYRSKKVVTMEILSFLSSFCCLRRVKIDYLTQHANGFCPLHSTTLNDQDIVCNFFRY